MVAQGGAFGGWSLYLHEGRPKYCYCLFGLTRSYVEGSAVVPSGEHQVRMEFAYDGGGLAKGGTVTLYVDGEKTADVGDDTGRSDVVLRRREAGEGRVESTESSRFTSRVNWVQLDIDEAAEDNDHLITAEERFHVAMARQ